MAGTIANLPLSQQFDKTTGKFLSGGKLYFFQANTSTPQSPYSDTGLTTTLPNPLLLDNAGRVPSFYLADGSIRARLTDKSGVVQFDEQNLLVIGPSGGGGGGGSTVDATAIFQTGMCIWLDQSGVLTGFVRDNARTIGSSTSGASERANADTQALFTFLWNTYSDTVCPVIPSRGASAAADWSANKQITLPDKRGCGPMGLDDMGNTAAGRFNGVPFTTGNATTVGSLCGEAAHVLSRTELPVITPTGTVVLSNNVGIPISVGGLATVQGGPTFPNVPQGTAFLGALGATFTGDAFGGGGGHNNTQRSVLGTFYRKL